MIGLDWIGWYPGRMSTVLIMPSEMDVASKAISGTGWMGWLDWVGNLWVLRALSVQITRRKVTLRRNT